MKITPGMIVKMKGTRDNGIRIVDHIEKGWQNDESVVCRQLKIIEKRYTNPTQKIVFEYTNRQTVFCFVETNVMTSHMPNKVSHVIVDGKFVKYEKD